MHAAELGVAPSSPRLPEAFHSPDTGIKAPQSASLPDDFGHYTLDTITELTDGRRHSVASPSPSPSPGPAVDSGDEKAKGRRPSMRPRFLRMASLNLSPSKSAPPSPSVCNGYRFAHRP
jgi:hypothetical protein